MLLWGWMIMLAASLLMLVFYLSGWMHPLALVIPIGLFILGTGGIFPNSFAAALSPYPKMAGMAAAVFGFIQLGGGAFSSYLLTLLPADNQFGLSVVIIAETVFAGGALLLAGPKLKLLEETDVVF